MPMMSWVKDEHGSTTVLTAVSLSAFLVFTAFLVDAAAAYVTQGRLQNFADAGADAGGATISNLIIERAMARQSNPPEGADPLAVLTEEDRQSIISDPRVTASARDFVERNRGVYGITLDAVEAQYPVNPVVCEDVNRRSVEVRVRASRVQPFLLGRLLNGNESTQLEASSIRALQLCAN